MPMTHVAGKNKGKVILYALSTCIWCRKTKGLLDDLGLKYSYIDMDLLTGTDQDNAYMEMEKYNPDANFPTVVINNGESVIIGFKEKDIKNLNS